MRIAYHKTFKKSFEKLSAESREKFRQNIKLFTIDPFDRRLNNHILKGKFANCRSINVGGDLRAIYKRIGNEELLFMKIGAHHDLYGK
jgi:addiction module RelE/StbE family toxin